MNLVNYFNVAFVVCLFLTFASASLTACQQCPRKESFLVVDGKIPV
jgi:hypothetical protein